MTQDHKIRSHPRGLRDIIEGDLVQWTDRSYYVEDKPTATRTREYRRFGLVLEVWSSNVYEPSESVVLTQVGGNPKRVNVETRFLSRCADA